jgi:hypothetical protein
MKLNEFQSMVFYKIEPYLASFIENGFKELIELKHLYQNLNIKTPSQEFVLKEIKDLLAGSTDPSSGLNETSELIISLLSIIEWKVIDPYRSNAGYILAGHGNYEEIVNLRFSLQTVKLFCGICKRTEPYNFQQGQDLLANTRGLNLHTHSVSEQVFSLVYQCQACKGRPEIFLVRRLRNKLTLSGRDPMEQFELPSYLPKGQRKYLSDSFIAFNSGQVLAGIFLMRTFIEQYVRNVSSNPNNQNIEALFSEYLSEFPEDFRQRFPSLYAIYTKLSEDIHEAKGSEVLYRSAIDDIYKHFDAKRLYDLYE